MSDEQDEARFSPDAVFERTIALRTVDIDDEMVVFDVLSDRCFRLNPTGTVIWRLLESRPTLDEITQRLIETYDLEKEVADDVVQEYLERLVDVGLVASTGETYFRSDDREA